MPHMNDLDWPVLVALGTIAAVVALWAVDVLTNGKLSGVRYDL